MTTTWSSTAGRSASGRRALPAGSAAATATPPLSAAEDIPWRCRRLVIGTGAGGALPVLNDVCEQARRRGVDLVIVPTAQAITMLAKDTKDTNAILHLTC